jgi:predicted nucleotidyltransferase
MSAAAVGSSSWDRTDADPTAFYREVMQALNGSGTPFLVGGAFAFACFTGIQRHTKDLDLFIRRGDYERVGAVLGRAGFETELTFPHWLAKAHGGEAFVDLIFNSGNGLSPVDEDWFEYAVDAEVLGVPVKIAPVEETLWSKATIMERERYDGADVAHLLRSQAEGLDWQRLLRRAGPNWRVLLSHLVLFGFIYPGERALVPDWLMDELLERLRRETRQPAPATRLCAGTLLSREQYLVDVEREGYVDGRTTPLSTMTPKDVAHWTSAIPSRQDADEA